MISFAGWGTKLAAFGTLLLGILIAVFRLISFGASRERAKVEKASRQAEDRARQVLRESQEQSEEDLINAKANMARGDYSDLDKL